MFRILGLLIMGAAIAYLGDRIGSKIGKKRLSILGLRPKHTAIIMTIFTGMVITFTTLYVSALVAPNIRLALFEDIHKIKEENEKLGERHQDLLKKKTSLEDKVLGLMDYMEILNQEKKRLVTDHEDTANEIEKLKAERTQLNDELSKRLMEGTHLREQIERKNQEAHVLEENLKELEQENRDIQAKQKAILKENKNYQQVMETLQDEKEKLISQLNSTLSEKIVLKQSKESLEQSVKSLLREKQSSEGLVKRLQEDLDLTRSVKVELEQDLEKNLKEIKNREEVLVHLRAEKDGLDQQVTQLEAESQKSHRTIASLKEVLQSKEQKQIVLNSMEPLIEDPIEIEGPVSREEFSEIFQRLLNEIKSQMRTKSISLGFLDQKLELEAQVFGQAAKIWKDIKNAHLYVDKPSKGVLVFPVSVNNLVSGERLNEVKCIVLENRLLILKGKEIARAILDANLSAEKVLAQLFEIDDQLKKQMFAQGILGNRFQPRPPKQIMQFAKIVNDVMSEKSKTFISIIADDDIYSRGNFAFRYNIHREKDYLRVLEGKGKPASEAQNHILERLRRFRERQGRRKDGKEVVETIEPIRVIE
jgi:myosin heavy subunit